MKEHIIEEIRYVQEYYDGYNVIFPDNWENDTLNLPVFSYDESFYFDMVPECVRTIVIPNAVRCISFSDRPNNVEKAVVERGSNYLWTDGDALYAKNRPNLICVVNHRLEEYTLNPKTRRIEKYSALNGLTHLRSLTFSKNMEFIRQFEVVRPGVHLSTIKVDPENAQFTTDGHAVLSKDGKTVFEVMCCDEKVYKIPEGVENIADLGNNVPGNIEKIILPTTAFDVSGYEHPGERTADLIEVPEDNQHLYYDGDAFYSKDKTVLLRLVRICKKFVVPSTVRVIGKDAFSRNNKLTCICLPENLREIQDRAFYYCENLQTISWRKDPVKGDFEFPPALEVMGNDLFHFYNGHFKIRRLEIPASVRKIGDRSLAGLNIEELTVLGNPETGANPTEDSCVRSPYFPCMPPSKIPKSLQKKAVYNFCERGLNGTQHPSADLSVYDSYLKRCQKKYCSDPLNNEVIIRYMTGRNLIGELQIDDLINKVSESDRTEFKALLLDYANRFESLGFERDEKKADKEFKREMQKQKDAKAAEAYHAMPLSERVGTGIKQNAQELVALLEETVLDGTEEDLKKLFETYQGFEFTARALGYAVRLGRTELIDILMQNGATFAYEATPAFVKKYDCKNKVYRKYSYQKCYALLAMESQMEEWPDEIRKREGAPFDKRAECIAMICRYQSGTGELQELLYQAILNSDFKTACILEENGIRSLGKRRIMDTLFPKKRQEMDAGTEYERKFYLKKLFENDPQTIGEFLRHLTMGCENNPLCFKKRELYVGYPEILNQLVYSEGFFKYVIEGKIDLSNVSKKQLITGFCQNGNISGLEYALEQQWVKSKEAIAKTAAKSDNADDKVKQWLNT